MLTEWDEFRWLDLDKVGELMAAPESSTPATCSTAPRWHAPGFDATRASGERERLMARVVVTGGAGFLGSHLCDAAARPGRRGRRASTTSSPGASANIEHLFGQPGVHVRRARRERLPLGRRRPVDAVLHFASPASPKDYLEIPIQTLKVGSLGTHNTLGLAKAKGARFFLASTSEVYGDPQVHPQPETYWGHVNPIGPRGVLRRGQALRRGA